MHNDFLKRLGYDVSYPLLKISSSEVGAIAFGKYTRGGATKIEAMVETITSLEDILSKPSEKGFKNPYAVGYEYAQANVNPTIGEIWQGLSEAKENEGTVKLEEFYNSDSCSNEQKKEVLNQLSTYFEHIAVGYSMFKTLQPLYRSRKIFEKHSEYINSIVFTESDFEKIINVLEILDELKYTTKENIIEVATRKKVCENMRSSFEKISTPDPRRTTEDKIENIKSIISTEKLKLLPESPYRQGYLIGLRGEKPLIVTLLTENYTIINYDAWSSFYTDFKGNSLQNATKLIEQILTGYAYSHFIVYLENRLEKISNKTSKAVTKEPTRGPVTLKWTGQKNQLYHVLRVLKEKGFLANSYEDLAVFLKTNVDVFTDNSISTINKELGKTKTIPKSKRVDLKL